MAASCPEGHPSESTDYCDVCGTPMAQAAGSPTAPASAPQESTQAPCPSCGAVNPADALFCEGCGYDYTTGAMPRGQETSVLDAAAPSQSPDAGAQTAPPSVLLDLDTPAPAQAAVPSGPAASAPEVDLVWVAEVWIDPEWYALQQAPDPLPSPGLPTVVPLRRRSLLVGRPSRSRGITPDIDCEPDSGTSRRQAQLTTDGTRWFVEDLDSANGTYVAGTGEPLPRTPIPVGRRHELQGDDRIFVGAWTRIVVRRVLPEEKELYS